MPKPPGDLGQFDKVNYVIDAWARPCEAPWYIYVSTLKPALLAAFITLITFGWDDVARGFLRPRGLGGRRTGKRKGKFLRGIPRFPEIGELIGSNLPLAEEVKGTRWSTLGKALWRIDTAIQQTLFYWLVADVAVDLAFNWTSVLYETRWCQASALGRFSYRTEEDHVIAGGRWSVVHYGIEDYEFSPPFWLHGQGGAGSRGAFVTATLTVLPRAGFPEPTMWGLGIVADRTEFFFAKTGPVTAAQGGTRDVVVAGNVPPNTPFQVKVWVDGSFATAGPGVVVGYEV